MATTAQKVSFCWLLKHQTFSNPFPRQTELALYWSDNDQKNQACRQEKNVSLRIAMDCLYHGLSFHFTAWNDQVCNSSVWSTVEASFHIVIGFSSIGHGPNVSPTLHKTPWPCFIVVSSGKRRLLGQSGQLQENILVPVGHSVSRAFSNTSCGTPYNLPYPHHLALVTFLARSHATNMRLCPDYLHGFAMFYQTISRGPSPFVSQRLHTLRSFSHALERGSVCK